MCSIIGYYGDGSAAPILVRGLKRMEYRGYDSVGVATKNDDIVVKKGVGKVSDVNSKLQLDQMPGSIGIGHTRWATHGNVTDANAHPHPSSSGKIAIVHNGIIENYEELKADLEKRGYKFQSQTDSEVIANLLQFNFDEMLDVKKAVMRTVLQLKGHYAFVAMFQNGMLVAAKYHEPLIIGIGKNGYFLSSDVLGFIEKTDDVIYLDNGEFVMLDRLGVQIYSFDGDPVKHQVTKVSKEFADAYKGEFAHFTLKEISEQPETIPRAGENSRDAIDSTTEFVRRAANIYITGSGTSYNAALVAKHLWQKYAKIKSEPIMSSELFFAPDAIESNSILVAISQSGESADVLEAVNIAKKSNAKIISIVNILTSSLAQESSLVIGMNCGPEIGVAATKSFTSQLSVIYKITEKLCDGCIKVDEKKLADTVSKILGDHAKIKEIAKELREIKDIYVLGRAVHYPIASEAALKLKELTYIHAEGIPGGELKHGPLALMDSSVYVIIINPNDYTYADTLTSAREIKARGAKIIGISDKPSDVYDHWIAIPAIDDVFYPLIEIIPIQLLAYYSAVEKNADPDYPRNLAKSVTVK
ncbi:MAG: glutamine--fructose-6-phosphate transaminase (isomerizing) [Candidatus Nitrosotenuis sp.]